MTTTLCPHDEVALLSRDGQTWYAGEGDGTPVRWEHNAAVSKLVLGLLDADEAVSLRLPENLADVYPQLTHLHLWNLSDLTDMPELPPGLKCLDIQKCSQLQSLSNLPAGLETLVIEDAAQLLSLPLIDDEAWDSLTDLSLRGCSRLDDVTLNSLLYRAPHLRILNLSKTLIREVRPNAAPASRLHMKDHRRQIVIQQGPSSTGAVLVALQEDFESIVPSGADTSPAGMTK